MHEKMPIPEDYQEVSIEGLPEVIDEQNLEKELDKKEALEQIFGDPFINKAEKQELNGSENSWDRFFKKGWQKIKPSKTKIQSDEAITRAQRQSPKNQ